VSFDPKLLRRGHRRELDEQLARLTISSDAGISAMRGKPIGDHAASHVDHSPGIAELVDYIDAGAQIEPIELKQRPIGRAAHPIHAYGHVPAPSSGDGVLALEWLMPRKVYQRFWVRFVYRFPREGERGGAGLAL
jgi:hypothetical protein